MNACALHMPCACMRQRSPAARPTCAAQTPALTAAVPSSWAAGRCLNALALCSRLRQYVAIACCGGPLPAGEAPLLYCRKPRECWGPAWSAVAVAVAVAAVTGVVGLRIKEVTSFLTRPDTRAALLIVLRAPDSSQTPDHAHSAAIMARMIAGSKAARCRREAQLGGWGSKGEGSSLGAEGGTG